MPATSKPGPKSARAKAAVSRNAIAHGVLANVPVLPGVEDEDEWRAYRAGIFESLAPDGHFECALAERAARLFWRLRRVERYETEMAALSQQRAGHDARLLTPPPASAPAPAATPAPTGALPAGPDDDAHTTDATPDNPAIARRAQELRVEHLLPPPDVLDRVLRYEAHLHRLLTAVLHELEAAQTRRRGGASPLARLDVTPPLADFSSVSPSHPSFRGFPPQ